MTSFKPTMAEAQAIGLCWLARKGGLPDIHLLRVAVVQLHPLSCGWCDYPLDELMAILKTFDIARDDKDTDRWQSLPRRAKGEAIKLAQGNELRVVQ